MPVNPDDVDEIATRVADLYREAEYQLVDMIVGHLDKDMDAPTWADDRLAAVTALRRSAESVVAGLSADGSAALRESVAAAYRTGRGAALTDLPDQWFPRSGIGQAARDAAATSPQLGAMEALATALVRDVGERSSNVLRDVLDAYRSVVTGATAGMLTGNLTRREAAQQTWSGLVKRGITGFTDVRGRRWELSTYAEMATRTVAQRSAVQGQTDRLASLGVDLVYVSNAPQECERCRPYEGRVLRRDDGPTGLITVAHTLTGEPVEVEVHATLDDARGRGLFHPNCRHSVSAYLPGVTTLPRQPTEDPHGDTARQEQRALERKIRKAKAQQIGALTPEAKKANGVKVRDAQAALREHLAAHPYLKRLRYREQRGAGSRPPDGKGPAAGGIESRAQPTLDGGPAAPPLRMPPTGVPENTAALDLADVVQVAGQQALDYDGAARAAAYAAEREAAEAEARRLAAAQGDVVEGVDLAAASDDALYELFEDLSTRDLPDEQAMARVWQELGDREERAASTPVVRVDPDPIPAPPPPSAATAVEGLSPKAVRLVEVWNEHPHWDLKRAADEAGINERYARTLIQEGKITPPGQVKAVEVSDDAWLGGGESSDQFGDWDDPIDLTPEQQQIDDLMSQGRSYLDAYAEVYGKDAEALAREEGGSSIVRRPGETVDKAIRRAYDELVHVQYLEAEEATNGYMVTKQGVSDGIDPASLFSGTTARAYKYASEELQRWWGRNPRVTFNQYKAQILGRQADKDRAKMTEAQAGDQEF